MPKLIKNVGGQHVEEPTVPISAGPGSAGRVPELNGAGGLDPSLLPDFYTRLAVQSRGMNLVTNGTALMGNSYNFSSFIYYPQDVFAGAASFLGPALAQYVTDELIPVNPNKYYRADAALKSINHVEEVSYAFGFSQSFDIDLLSINPEHVTYDPPSFTSLTQPLAVGDTVIHVADASGWGGRSYNWVKIHKYRNAKGFDWPVKTYSRTVHFIISGPSPRPFDVFEDSGIDKTANTIALSVPWGNGINGAQVLNPDDGQGTWPIGTPISSCFPAGTFQYFLISNTKIPNEWTPFSGVIGGIEPNGQAPTLKFPHGTAFIKLGFLLNGANGFTPHPQGITGNTTAVSALSLSEVTVENFTGGLPGWTGSFLIQDGRNVTVKGGIITAVQ